MSYILVLSPHPDDEAIGLGGTIRLHVQRGDVVEVIFLTSGEQGVKDELPEDVARIREDEARNAASILGYDRLDFWREPDGSLQPTPGLVDRLRRKIALVRPELIYVPHDAERHQDHRSAAQLVADAISPADSSTPRVLMYEVWTPLHQIDHVEDISDQIETKLMAIRAHKSQCELLRFDEAICGLNRYRGIMHSWYGVAHSEVFRRFN